MKAMLILIILFTFLNLNAQEPAQWNPKLQTYIPYAGGTQYIERVANFANHYGIHVLKSIHDGTPKHVRYFRLTSEGEKPTNFPTDGILLDSHGDFPNIVGDENIIYVVYRKDYTIQVKYSTDGGDNWDSIEQIDFENGNATNCNGVDAAYTFEKGLHVVWSEKVSGNYESYFKRYDVINGWGITYPLTNVPTLEIGGFPTVTTSYYNGQYKAHVTINGGNSDLLGDNQGVNYIRDYDYLSFSVPLQIIPTGESKIDRLLVTEDGLIHSFYYTQPVWPILLPQYKYRKKPITSSVWGPEKEIEFYVIYENMHKIQIAKTSCNVGIDTIHAFWIDESGGFWQRKKNSSDEEWTIPKYNVSLGGVSFRDVAAAGISNDLFALWSQYGGSGYYEFRHYDDIPLAPQDLAVEAYTVGEDEHPKLTWTLNNEPDVYHAEDAYEIQRRTRTVPGLWDRWSSIAYVDGDVDNYIDTDLLIEGSGSIYQAEYKIRATDLGGHISPWSSVVSIYFGAFNKLNTGLKNYDYMLSQNYPNPFNPSTQISYSLKQEADVTVKVYDVLGTEVADLVNEMQTAGLHDVNFNANNLASGVYIYRITASKNGIVLFANSKQMLLMK